MKKKIVIGVIILLLIGLGSYFLFFRNKGQKPQTYLVKRGKIEEQLILSGFVDADEFVSLAFGTSGKIAWVGVGEGDSVAKGTPLAKLDTQNLNSTYQRALSDLRSAEASVQKAHDDVKDHSGDETYAQKETRTTAEVAKDKAYEAVKIAQQDLRNATLFSPFSGIVTYVANPFAGVNILATQTQFEIINPETIFFNVSADQTEVVDITLGQKVNVILDSFPDKTLTGSVTFVSFAPKTDESGSVYKVKINLAQANLANLKMGMTGDAKFILSEKQDVLYVNPQFVKSDRDGKYVNLGSPKNKVRVETGIENEEMVEITKGVNEGDVIYD